MKNVNKPNLTHWVFWQKKTKDELVCLESTRNKKKTTKKTPTDQQVNYLLKKLHKIR